MQKVWVLYCLQRTKATVMQWLLCLFVSLTLTLILIYFFTTEFCQAKKIHTIILLFLCKISAFV